ncbi:MAG: Ig-like domain-containing protein [Actinomycetota bacterium]|nr:Ig-like domain-containing protein [Actinomycetota bacterium]
MRQPLGSLTGPAWVRWLAPADGSTVSGSLSGSRCQVAARDSVGVTKVEFYLDGALVGTDANPPYSCQLNATVLSGGTHILKAEAYDAAGNVWSAYAFVSTPSSGARALTVTVQGDSLTVGSWSHMPAELGSSFDLVSISAHHGRPSVRGLALLPKQRLGRIVVFALGTNDWWASPRAYRDRLAKVVHLLGPSRCLVVPTIWRAGRADDALNAVLHSLARHYGPARMQLAPWAQAVAARRVLLLDGTHPANQAGWQLRARIVDAAVRACARARRPVTGKVLPRPLPRRR